MLLTFQATMYHLRAPVDTVVPALQAG